MKKAERLRAGLGDRDGRAVLPKPADNEALAFVEGASRHRQLPRHAETVQGSGRGAVPKRQDGRLLRRMTIYLPVEVAEGLERYCFERGRREYSDVVSEAVEMFLAGGSSRTIVKGS